MSRTQVANTCKLFGKQSQHSKDCVNRLSATKCYLSLFYFRICLTPKMYLSH